MVTARPMRAVAKPTAVSSTISPTQTAMARLLRSTALMLVTTAVIASVSRSQIIGSEKALTAKVSSAKIEPTAEPMVRNVASCRQSGWASTGKNTWTMDPARAQTRNTTSSASANTIAVPRLRFCSTRQRPSEGGWPRSSCRLTEYRASASTGATNTKPESSTSTAQ